MLSQPQAGGRKVPQQQCRSLFLPLAKAEVVVFVSFYTLHLQPTSSLMSPPATAARQWAPDCMLLVLADASIVVYSLESDANGPTVIHRITPQVRPAPTQAMNSATATVLPSNKSMTSDAESMASRPGSPVGSPGGRIGSAQSAVCASLVPRHLCAYLSAEFFHHHPMIAAQQQQPGRNQLPAADGQQAAQPMLRGIVGFSGGRVEVFSSNAYVFGFLAHSCDVRDASIVHAGDFSNASSPATQPSTRSGADATLMSVNSVSTSRKYLDDVCRTAFVTMGVDGNIFVWRRRNAQDGYEAASLQQPGVFSKCHAMCVVQPALDVCGGALSCAWQQHAQTAATAVPAPSSMISPLAAPAPPLPFVASLVVSGGNGYSSELLVSSVDSLAPAEQTVEIPSGSFARISAVAAEGSMILVAREKIVFAVTYSPRTVNRVLTTNTTVLQLELSKPLAVAGCRSGKLVVFGAETGTVLMTHETYSGRCVRGLSFHYNAMLLSVLDETGAVELLELPADFLRHGVVPSEAMLSSALVLKKMIQLEESSSGDGALATARRALGEESLLLARVALPQCLRTYLGAQHVLL